MDEPILVDRRRAAQLLGVSLRTLDYLIQNGELSGVRRIGRRCLIDRRALENFARRDHPTVSLARKGAEQ